MNEHHDPDTISQPAPSLSHLTVSIRRGGFEESRHEVSAVVWESGRGLTQVFGDPSDLVFPRSAIKMLQVTPYVRTLQKLGRPAEPKRLALACASHWGEAQHVDVARAWLNDLSLPIDILRCGAHVPFSDEAANELVLRGEKPTRLHNNCSGKHLAMLETCLLMGEDPAFYYQADHPCQKRVANALAELMGLIDLQDGWGLDGCGIPAYRMPIESLARALARFAELAKMTDVFRAVSEYPQLLGGRDDESSRLSALGRGRFIAKIGAEGVMAVTVRASEGQPAQGLLIKVRDGAERAAGAAVQHLLAHLGLISAMEDPAVHPRVLKNWAGESVGAVKIERDAL